MPRTILIGSDGRRSAEGALRVGSALARRLGAPAEVLAVLPGLEFSALSPPTSVPAGYGLLDEVTSRDLALSVEAQMERVLGPDERWPVRVESGLPAPALAARALALDAALVVVGIDPPVLADAWHRGGVVLELVRVSAVPVLVVPVEATGAPKRVLAGVDFGPLSVRAARRAAALLGEGDRLYLLHATWPGTETTALPSLTGWKSDYDREAEERLQALAREIGDGRPYRVEAMLGHGEPAPELLGAADRLRVDAVAVGTRGNETHDAGLVGEVALELVRRGHCGVLLAPSPPERAPQPAAAAPTGLPNPQVPP